MNRKTLIKSLNDYFEPMINELNFELVDLEFIKENNRNILRFYIDKTNGININDCQKASEIISEELDKLDPIKDAYYLEVSSPGLDRPLKTNKDLKRNIGKDIEVNLYKSIDGKKQIIGELLAYDDDFLIVYESNSEEVSIDRKYISQIKLWVDF